MLQDLRFTARYVARNPRSTVAVVGLLALGIGANTAVFSVVHALLVRPLPYANPDRLVRIWESHPERGISRSAVSRANYFDWRERAASFEYIEAFNGARDTVVRFGSGDPEVVRQASGTDRFLEMLGVAPSAGSLMNRRPISYGFWQRRFGGDPQVLGMRYTIEGFAQYPQTIEGVMPQGFDFPAGAESWTVLSFERSAARDVNVVARLKRGVSLEQARAEMDALAAALAAARPGDNSGWHVEIVPLRDAIVGDVRATVWLLYGAVCLILGIAIMNAAGLQLARRTEREHEAAVQLALGASVARLARQRLIESVLLTAAGAAIGFGIAVAAIRIIPLLAPPSIPRVHEISISAGVLATGAAVCAVASLLLWALSSSGLQLTTAALTAGGRETGSRRSQLSRSAVMVGQIALCVALLFASVLVVRSFVALQRAPNGFDSGGLLTIQVRQPIIVPGEVVRHYPLRRFARVTRQAIDSLRTLPGVESVAGAMQAPLTGVPRQAAYKVVERPVQGPYRGTPSVTAADARLAALHIVTPAYFETLAIPLKAGRSFDDGDRLNDAEIDDHNVWRGVGVAIVSEAFARREWPGDSGVGRYLIVDAAEYRSVRIVGIVGDVRTVAGAPLRPAIYLPDGQSPRGNVTLFVRTSGDPLALAAAVRDRMRAFGSEVAAFNIRTMDEIVAGALARPRFSGAVMFGFGVVAVLFTAAGLYSLLSFVVSQRSREFAVRIAIGAAPRDLVRTVVGWGLRLTAAGGALGALSAIVGSQFLRSILPELQARDWPLLTAVMALVFAVAWMSSYVPARRAARLDPIAALRSV